MKFLPDQVVARLRSEIQTTEIQTPDLSGTRYRAINLLGSGGMGAVWLAEDSVLHRNVALKVLFKALSAESSSADLGARLMQEAAVLARLEHPGIVPIHDAGTLADGRTFYCMKHVQGLTLDQHIAGTGLRQRLQLLQRIAEPLAFAHSQGVVHRDLKPGNIMVGAFGEVLVMDWGLAKVMGAALAGAPKKSSAAEGADISEAENSAKPHSKAATTAHGAVLGTPGYMAPEQARGDQALIDQRTDVYGLGALLQFMIAADAQGSEDSQGSQLAPRRLLAICRKAMAGEMSERYASVQELAADIGRYLDDLPIAAYRENIFERAIRLVSRNRVAVVLVVAYLMMRLLFALFSRR